MLLEKADYEINLSVPLLLEYEDVSKRQAEDLNLDTQTIDDILDYLCSVAKRWEVHYLWRPHLKDPKDDMVLEVAVVAKAEIIVTYNKRDFQGAEQFGIRLMTPRELLVELGEIK